MQEKRKCGEADYQLSGQGFKEIMLSITRCEDSKNVTPEADEAKREIASEIIKSLEGSLTYQPNQPLKKVHTTKSNRKRYFIIDLGMVF